MILHNFARLLVSVFMIMLIIVVLMRAVLYDDGGLPDLLFPSECEMPCFLGIRPGVTTRDEAIAILESHEWIGEVTVNEREIFARWNNVLWGTTFNPNTSGGLHFTIINNLVAIITYSIPVKIVDLLINLRSPSFVVYNYVTFNGINIYSVEIYYDSLRSLMRIVSDCPTTPNPLYAADVLITMRFALLNEGDFRGYEHGYDGFKIINHWCRNN